MSRVASVVFGTVILGIVASVTGCRVSVETKNRYVKNDVKVEDTADWNGQAIKIDIAGVGIASNPEVKVVADPNATKVRATARLLAMAFENEEANALQTRDEAEQTFKITNTADEITLACGHGQKHGSAEAGESGCEAVDIVIPTGTDAKKLAVTVLSGNAQLTLQLSSAVVSNIGTNANGGDTNADLPATQGASISLVSQKGDDIAAKLPADFAADEVILQSDADKIALGPFTDIKQGAGAGGRGTAGTGLASLKITSKEFAGTTGQITLR
jgi:hypothetical protein